MHCIYYNIDILICYKQSLFLFDKIIFPFRLNPNNAPSSSPREAFDSQVEYKQGYCLSPLTGFHPALQYRVLSCPAIQGSILPDNTGFHPALQYRVPSCPAIQGSILPCNAGFHPALQYRVPSCPAIQGPILPCNTGFHL